MKFKVASYLMGIPPGNTNPEKPTIIVNFVEGVRSCGDEGIIVTDYNPIDADVAVVQGYVHPGSKNVPHLNLRKSIFEKQKRDNKRSIIVDSNLFLYADPGNTKGYLRYSYDGIFPNTGEYCNSNPNPQRWDIISKNLNIKLKPLRTYGKYILICCQRDGGWSMGNNSLVPWLIRTITEIKKYSSRPIVVRFHPGDKNSLNHKISLSRYKFKDVIISQNENILEDFVSAYAVINFNSSPAVAAAIEGIPTFVLDPIHSQAAEVSHHSLNELEKIREFDRELWVQKMAQMHWNLQELKDGTAWQHLRKWAKK